MHERNDSSFMLVDLNLLVVEWKTKMLFVLEYV